MPTNFLSFVYIIVFLCWEIEEKISASTLKTYYFKASGGITTNFGSRTLHNNINKWPKVGRHDWPFCMISDNFKKVILLYVYHMGCIDFCYRVYLSLKLSVCNFAKSRKKIFKIIPGKVGLSISITPSGHPWYILSFSKSLIQFTAVSRTSMP